MLNFKDMEQINKRRKVVEVGKKEVRNCRVQCSSRVKGTASDFLSPRTSGAEPPKFM